MVSHITKVLSRNMFESKPNLKRNHRMRSWPCSIRGWLGLAPSAQEDMGCSQHHGLDSMRENNEDTHDEQTAIHNSGSASAIEDGARSGLWGS